MLACRNIANRGRLGHYAKHSSNSTLLNKNVLVDWLLFYGGAALQNQSKEIISTRVCTFDYYSLLLVIASL